MLQEMAAEGVLHHKLKSRSRGISWQRVVDKVNALPNFEVNVKSVRDRFKLLAKKHKAKMGKQERSTGGGGVDLSEVEILLDDLIGIEDDTKQRAEEEYKTKKVSEDKDRAKARAVARTLIGGCIFIYSGSASLVSFEIKLISKEVSRA